MHWRLLQWQRQWRRWRAPKSLLAHAQVPLGMPTYDGSGQATHPDLLFFPGGWPTAAGPLYWLVLTPYPFLDDSKENPALLVSRDGLAWQPPAGAPDPLVATPAEGYHADPDLIHHPPSNALWLYYLHTIRGREQHLRLLRSPDGCHWQGPLTLFSLPYQEIRSPALAWDGATLVMWSVNMRAGAILERRTSPDGLAWSPPETCRFRLPGYTPSHLDVVRLADGQWRMVVQANPDGGGPNPLFWAASRDGRQWRTARRPLLSPWDGPAWSSRTLYRTTFLCNGERVRLWYAGRSEQNENRLGYAEGALPLLDAALRRGPFFG